MEYYSQPWIGQDVFVAETLNFLKDGFFVDIGCHHYKDISNTYFFEKELNWRGLAIDVEAVYENDWLKYRPKSRFVCQDGRTVDYENELKALNAPQIIDYLTLDTEPPEITLECLIKILETPYTFKVITFETDRYRCDAKPGDISREILKNKGYTFIKDVAGQDDFWINYNALSA